MRVGVIGCAGFMGGALVREILAVDGAELNGGTERAGSDAIGIDIGVLASEKAVGIAVSDDLDTLVANSDAVIDFTAPTATLNVAQAAATHGTTHIIGTTGMSDDEKTTIKNNTNNHVTVQAHNFSVGVNVLLGLVEQAAHILSPENFDIEVVEMHHNRKVDAPSGTALSLGEAAAHGRGVTLDDVAVKERSGIIEPRKTGEIGFATLRGGDVVGDHTVMFASELERIELTHKAQDRSLFAHGAVRAALWSAGKTPGYYGMKDVLGL